MTKTYFDLNIPVSYFHFYIHLTAKKRTPKDKLGVQRNTIYDLRMRCTRYHQEEELLHKVTLSNQLLNSNSPVSFASSRREVNQ